VTVYRTATIRESLLELVDVIRVAQDVNAGNNGNAAMNGAR
jgi:hypothetical protein